jgi:hypothetical protein
LDNDQFQLPIVEPPEVAVIVPLAEAAKYPVSPASSMPLLLRSSQYVFESKVIVIEVEAILEETVPPEELDVVKVNVTAPLDDTVTDDDIVPVFDTVPPDAGVNVIADLP